MSGKHGWGSGAWPGPPGDQLSCGDEAAEDSRREKGGYSVPKHCRSFYLCLLLLTHWPKQVVWPSSDSEGGEVDLSPCGEAEQSYVAEVAQAGGGHYSLHLSQGLR